MLTIAKRNTGNLRTEAKSFLSSIESFKNIPAAALDEIERSAFLKRHAKGESLFLEDDPAESLWFVKEGHIKEIFHSPEGRSLTLSMVGRGGLFGTSSFGGGEYGCHCVAETDAVVISFPIQVFQTLMGRYPEIARHLVAQISNLLRWSKDMQTFAQENVEKRILHILLNLVKEFGNTIPLTRREIGEMAGTTVESSIRTLSKFENARLISSVRGKIIVKDTQALTDLLGEL